MHSSSFILFNPFFTSFEYLYRLVPMEPDNPGDDYITKAFVQKPVFEIFGRNIQTVNLMLRFFPGRTRTAKPSSAR